jgi:hypothetical protein
MPISASIRELAGPRLRISVIALEIILQSPRDPGRFNP